jgi:hypothetical protein
LQELSAEESCALHLQPGKEEVTYGARSCQESTLEPGRKANSPPEFLQHPLLTKLNIMPTSRGEIFQGPTSIFMQQAVIDGFETEMQLTNSWHTICSYLNATVTV